MSTVVDQPAAIARAERGAVYRSTAVVSARRLTDSHEWTSGSGSALAGEAGDWLVTDGSDEWTVSDTAFAASYTQQPEGSWRKTATVRAIQLDEPLDVETPEGMSHGEPGDWLVTGSGAGAWPVPAAVFADRYVRD